ncbi:chromosome condensation regulator RCC1 [Paeniglutamicibacter antarcticus]|uniref:Chromosome condensation regulator RCC1 n=1 Tax=Arthrobacter terrae TaxID=2935737 RepID=A0A931CHV2_9MICC|nr:chromosome condensation regulator RCC1 [Arthrobacter terrae]MBG0738877.1 chromosome condensation regulator RCC1 [Arthrobacter terrae]
MTPILRRLKHVAAGQLRNERGSVAASVAFTVFTALMILTVVAAVIASLGTTTIMNNQSAVNAGSSQQQDAYLNAVVHGIAAPTGQSCVGVICSQITGTTDADGVRSVTVEGKVGDKAPSTRIQTLRQISPNMITGYDDLGNPVWASQKDTTPYRFTSLISRGNSSCAIDADKTAWCWGANDHGQLGDGTTTNRSVPVKVHGTAKFTALTGATGDTFCGLDTDGKAWCWGDNTAGQLGTGATTIGTSSSTPVAPTGDHKFTALFTGPTTTCGIDTDKKTWCWGANPGNGTSDPAPDPAAVLGSHDFTTLTMDASTACGLETGGKVFCWATAATGRTGTDPAPGKGTPVEVAGGRTYTHIQTANEVRTDTPSVLCAIDTGSKAWCWGTNGAGQLGNGTTTDSLVPTAVTGDHDFKALTVSPSAVCGIDSSSHTWCWGDNSAGQLGIGSMTSTKDPAAVDPGTEYSAITPATNNGKSFCAIVTDGAAKCWGENNLGQAQEGTTTPVTSPASLGAFKGLRSLSAGAAFSCVTDARSETSCWGRNDAGQTGNGAFTPTNAPLPAARKDLSPPPFTGYLKGGK